jgi:hypothetical protein
MNESFVRKKVNEKLKRKTTQTKEIKLKTFQLAQNIELIISELTDLKDEYES